MIFDLLNSLKGNPPPAPYAAGTLENTLFAQLSDGGWRNPQLSSHLAYGQKAFSHLD
ncbi:hypothetical protein TbrSNM41_05620 [Thermus brockianus]|uniref:Uncharacterized protein n=1 Tax=Thermus brockianus TaxID=56956 RepID=A0ABM7XHR4_THEBO|nr:hypothetical protein TbrSNM41_05620 [Thermus brockianus]